MFQLQQITLTRFLIIFITVKFLLFTLLYAGNAGISPIDRVFIWGEFYNQAIFSGGAWLLVTSMFLHYDPFHYLLNIFALWQLLTILRIFFRERVLFSIFVLGGLAGNLATLVFTNPSTLIFSVGASGGVFALLGLILGGSLKQNALQTSLPFNVTSLMPTILVALVLSFLPGINWLAHLGGFAVGTAYGYFLPNALTPLSSSQEKLENRLKYFIIGIFVLSYAALIGNLILNLTNS